MNGGWAEYNGVIYKYSGIRGDLIFLMDVVGRRGFDTIVVRVSDVKIICVGEISKYNLN